MNVISEAGSSRVSRTAHAVDDGGHTFQCKPLHPFLVFSTQS